MDSLEPNQRGRVQMIVSQLVTGRATLSVLLVSAVLILALVGGCTSSKGPTESDDDGPDVAPTSVLVTAGSFTMGDGSSYCGQDEREVTLTHDFHLFQHEVTNEEYVEALQWAYDNGHVTVTETSVQDGLDESTAELVDLSDWSCEIQFTEGTFSIRDVGAGLNPDHPVKQVSWYGAARYCDWLSLQENRPRAYEHSGDWTCNGGDPYGARGYRLPTDAEWEYAAQYNDERIYPWGNEAPHDTLANYGSATGWTTPAGAYPDAPAELGLSDMAGNIMEWCNDWHVCEVGTEPVTNPAGPAGGTMRMLRGGAWNGSGNYLTCAIRRPQDPGLCNRDIGFRAARTAAP
jgi:formylglycine-generating enzyme required for sulfatase activity